jgi:hypothetical protein
MNIDLKNVKNIKKIKTNNVIDLFENNETYSTEVFFKKDIVNGKTVIRGVFSSKKKDNAIGDYTINELEEGQFYYSNNDNDLKLTDDKRVITHKNAAAVIDNKIDWKVILFYSASIIILIELSKYFTNIGLENKLIADKCYQVKYIVTKEYIQNECSTVKLDDGPILNKFCQDKQICINDARYVFLTQIIVKIFKEGIEWITSSYTLIALLLVIFIFLIKIKY